MNKRMQYDNETAVSSYFKDIRKYTLITKDVKECNTIMRRLYRHILKI